MRFTLESVPTFLLIFLLLDVAYYGHGLFTTVFYLIIWAFIRLGVVGYDMNGRGARLIQKRKRPLVLNALPISHYVEKVRWNMDKLGVPYESEDDAGILGVLLFGRFLPGLHDYDTKSVIYNSSDILRYLYGKFAAEEKAQFLKPTKEALALEEKIDKFGADARRFIYHVIFDQNDPEVNLKVWGVHMETIPEWQKMLLKLTSPVLVQFIKKGLKVDEAGAREGKEKAERFLDEVDALLKDGRKYLMGTDEPTYVDYSFAAMAHIIIFPPNAGGKGLNSASRMKLEELPVKFKNDFKAFRNRPSGQFVTRMYKEHRDCDKKSN